MNNPSTKQKAEQLAEAVALAHYPHYGVTAREALKRSIRKSIPLLELLEAVEALRAAQAEMKFRGKWCGDNVIPKLFGKEIKQASAALSALRDKGVEV